VDGSDRSLLKDIFDMTKQTVFRFVSLKFINFILIFEIEGVFAWRDCRIPQNISVTITILRAEI
jgi:hypothetical protein